MCLIQLPALVAVILILACGRYSAHPITFWTVIVLALLACWSRLMVRAFEMSGVTSAGMTMTKMLFNTLPLASWIASIVGIIVSFQ